MARIKFVLVAVVAISVTIVVSRFTASPVHAQPRTITANPRLTVMPTGVLDSPANGIRAAFIKDVETGDCWLWVNESGAGSALAPATKTACR